MLSLPGIAFMPHFPAAGYYPIDSPPTGLSTGPRAPCVLGVLLAGFAAAKKG